MCVVSSVFAVLFCGCVLEVGAHCDLALAVTEEEGGGEEGGGGGGRRREKSSDKI